MQRFNLSVQGWFGGKKMKAAIGFDKVVDILYKFQAPADVSTRRMCHLDTADVTRFPGSF